MHGIIPFPQYFMLSKTSCCAVNPKEDACIFGSPTKQMVPGSQQEFDKWLSLE